MPRSLMYTVRAYRTGSYSGSSENDPHVMTTRSGQLIRKGSTGSKSNVTGVLTQPLEMVRRSSKFKKKHKIVKYKSMSYMSFVTRFHLCLRVPEMNFAGVNSKETLQYSELYPFSSCEESDEDEYKPICSHNNNNNQIDETLLSGKMDMGMLFQNGETVLNLDSSKQSVFSKGKGISSNIILTASSYDETHFLSNSTDYDLTSSKVTTENDDAVLVGDFNSEISNDTFIDANSSPLIRGCEDPMSECKVLKLRDVKLKVHVVDGITKQQLFRCSYCEQIFTALSTYVSHLKNHMKTKNICILCGKIFSRSWLLKGHMRTHTGEKPFPCSYKGCDKAFADKSNLRSHQMTHTVTIKDYHCDKCGRAFAQKRYLHKHMQEVCRTIF